MRKHKVTVVEYDGTMFDTEAWINGQMSDGTKTWEFEGMDEDAIYLASKMRNKKTGKVQYVLFRQ